MTVFRFLSQARRAADQFNNDCDCHLPPCRVYRCDMRGGYVLVRTYCDLPRVGLRLIPARRGIVARLAGMFR